MKNIDINKFKEMYPVSNMEEILSFFNLSRKQVHQLAFKLKVKRLTRDNRSERDLSPLLGDDLQSFYWIGFILADGSVYRTYLSIKIQCTDIDFLKEFSRLTKSKISFGRRKDGDGFSGKDFCKICVSHKEVVDKLKVKFNIKSNKTYAPPDTSLWDFSKEQCLALIAGFIDGDGSITKNENFTNIDVSNHISWFSFHNWMKNVLFLFTNDDRSSVLSVNKRGQSKIRINQKTTFLLFDFLKENNLFFMHRKWIYLNSHRRYKDHSESIANTYTANS